MSQPKEIKLTSQKPHFLRAVYYWLCENTLRIYIDVDLRHPGVVVPKHLQGAGKVVQAFNIGMNATPNLDLLDNDKITFTARYSGQGFNHVIPMDAIIGIRGPDLDNIGMLFQQLPALNPSEVALAGEASNTAVGEASTAVEGDVQESAPPIRGKPFLSIVK